MRRFQPLLPNANNDMTRRKTLPKKSVLSRFLSGMAVEKRVAAPRVNRMLAPRRREPSPEPSPLRGTTSPPSAPGGDTELDEADWVDAGDAAEDINRSEDVDCTYDTGAASTLLVLHTEAVERHLVGPERQERPERTIAARKCAERFAARRGAVAADWAAGEAVGDGDLTRAILRAHTGRYYESLEAAVRGAAAGEIVNLTPAGDTVGCAGSLAAARRAAAVGLDAVRRVCAGDASCAVCLVRPPGHHVARDGKTDVAPSQGFCLLNTVAIAALEAASALGRSRVAVVDFDIHHGNGTQDILGSDGRFFFGSAHAHGGGTYPGTGGPRDAAPANVLNVPIRGTVTAKGFRAAVAALARRVAAFEPDLLLLSAGFDGHRDDLAGLGALDARDYGECTTALLRAAGAGRGVGVVSVLEGGYGRWCAPKRKKPKAKKNAPGPNLAAAIDDARLASFDACLDAHLEAIAAFYAPPPPPPRPASPSTVGTTSPLPRARLTFDSA